MFFLLYKRTQFKFRILFGFGRFHFYFFQNIINNIFPMSMSQIQADMVVRSIILESLPDWWPNQQGKRRRESFSLSWLPFSCCNFNLQVDSAPSISSRSLIYANQRRCHTTRLLITVEVTQWYFPYTRRIRITWHLHLFQQVVVTVDWWLCEGVTCARYARISYDVVLFWGCMWISTCRVFGMWFSIWICAFSC